MPNPIDPTVTAPYSRAISMLQMSVTTPVSQVQTWLDHPTYNTKTDILAYFRAVHIEAWVIGRLFNRGTPYPVAVFQDAGYDYNLWSNVWDALREYRRHKQESSDKLRLALREYYQKGTPR